jgi:ABC-2 type transport system permease protein
MTGVWTIARHDVRLWLRSPGLIAASIVPAVGMGLLVAVLTLSIGRQPVALVQDDHGPLADHIAHLLEVDDEAYVVQRMGRADADRALRELRVAAVVVIPADFDERVATSDARLELALDNVLDVDLADDIRRAVTRSLAEFDAPQLGIVGELHGPGEGLLLPNPFRIAIAENDRRDTTVEFFEYELVPIYVMVVLSVGLLGTSLSVAGDRRRKTSKVVALAPVGPSVVVAGRLLGSFAAALSVLVPLVGLSMLAGWLKPPPGHWPAFVAVLGMLTIASVGLGLALGIAVKRTRVLAMLGLNISAYLFFLGGGFATVAFLPAWLRAASAFVPTSYAISALRQVLFYPDLHDVGRDVAVLAATATASVMLGAAALGRSFGRS